MLTHNSFLIDDKALRHAVDIIAVNQPWHSVIRNGRSVAANAARNSIKTLIDAADRGISPTLATLSVPLQAVYVLSIHLITHPRSRLAGSDMSVSSVLLRYPATNIPRLN